MLEDMRLSPKTGHDRLPINSTTRFTYENGILCMGKVQEWESQISFGPDQLFDEAVSDLTNISTMKIVSITS